MGYKFISLYLATSIISVLAPLLKNFPIHSPINKKNKKKFLNLFLLCEPVALNTLTSVNRSDSH